MTYGEIFNFQDTHFNSHAHVERDALVDMAVDNKNISTHTLTWSVTRLFQVFNLAKSTISTHTLTWSVTCARAIVEAGIQISTHTLTWSVTMVHLYHLHVSQISTHTLTWSVTLDVVYIWCLLNVMRTYFFI